MIIEWSGSSTCGASSGFGGGGNTCTGRELITLIVASRALSILSTKVFSGGLRNHYQFGMNECCCCSCSLSLCMQGQRVGAAMLAFGALRT